MAAPDPSQPLHCPHFGICGGCSLLDRPIEAQLQGKLAALQAEVAGWLEGVAIECPQPPRTPRHDRTQILYPVQPHPHLALTMGIYRTGTHEVEEIADCRIQHRTLTALGPPVQKLFRKTGLSAYDETTGGGLVRAFHARIAAGTNQLLLGVVTTGSSFHSRDRIAEGLRELASGLRDEQGRPVELVGIVHNINRRPGNALLGDQNRPMWGEDHLLDRTPGGLSLRVTFGSFYQTNRHADAILYRPALAMLGDVRGLTVVDGYGGVGAFGLRLAAAGATRVTVVESHPLACADARHNAAANGMAGVGVVEAPFAEAAFDAPDVLVADPSRAGLQEAGAARVRAAAARRVLLVSCSQKALARDLGLLASDYRVTAMRLCDLFPHTEHVEVVTLLERR